MSAHDDGANAASPVRVARIVYDGNEPARTQHVSHSYAVLSFFTGGRMHLEQQKGHWALAEGDVILIPAGAPHRMLGAHPSESWGMAFCVPCFGAEMSLSLLAPFERVRDGAAPVVRIPSERRAFLSGLFEELEQVSKREDEVGDAKFAVQKSLLTLVLSEVNRAAKSAPAESGTVQSVVTDSLRYIEKHCLRALTLQEVAKAVGRTPAYVTSALKEATGRSAVQWIVTGRMAESRRLLLHSDEHVDIIAERVGYADATHFIRMFRREHGMTPAAWRTAQSGRSLPTSGSEKKSRSGSVSSR